MMGSRELGEIYGHVPRSWQITKRFNEFASLYEATLVA